MATWVDDDSYKIDSSARGDLLQNETSVFWQRVFETLLAEQAPFEQVLFETAWDGPRYIVYALQLGKPGGYDTGWRLQCFVPRRGKAKDRWELFLAAAEHEPAASARRALRSAKPGIVFYRSDRGEESYYWQTLAL